MDGVFELLPPVRPARRIPGFQRSTWRDRILQAESSLALGDTLEAWEKAADLSNEVHIIYKDKPYKTILGLCPQMYDDIWTAGKVMYKLEPIVADGGTLIIYAPHISEVSYTHGPAIEAIGYHCRDYFLKQWERFERVPGGILAHSTHLRGLGSYDAVHRIESEPGSIVCRYAPQRALETWV